MMYIFRSKQSINTASIMLLDWTWGLAIRTVAFHNVWGAVSTSIRSEFVNTHLVEQELFFARCSDAERRHVMYYGMKGVLLLLHLLRSLWCAEGVAIGAMWSMNAMDLCMLYRQQFTAPWKSWEVWATVVCCGVISMSPPLRTAVGTYMSVLMLAAPSFLAISAAGLWSRGIRSNPPPSYLRHLHTVGAVVICVGWTCLLCLYVRRLWESTEDWADWLLILAFPWLAQHEYTELRRTAALFTN